MPRSLTVCAVQMRHGDRLEDNLYRARAHLEAAAEEGVDLAVLPEYFFAPPPPYDLHGVGAGVREMLALASGDLGLAVAGNVVEATDGDLLNVGLVYDGGEAVLEQPKVHPMPREAEMGLVAGDGYAVADVRDVPVGLLVCADVLFPEVARALELRGARVLLNPVMSPYRADDPTRQAREALYVGRAYDAGAFVVKAGGVRGDDVVGRSLVAAPWGLLARYADERAEELLVAELDLDRLVQVRKAREAFPARRPGAYRDLVE